MKNTKTGLLVSGIVILAVCRAVAGAPLQTNIFTHATNTFRAADLLTLRQADSIRALRIELSGAHTGQPRPQFGGYPILSASSRTNAALARAVSTALLNETMYCPAGLTRCLFDPVIGFVIGKETNTLDLLVCFQCNQISIGASHRPGGYFLHFNTSRPRLLALARQVFPGDPVFEPAKPPANRFE